MTLACALSALAQSPDETAKRFHVLPHLADGGGWQSVLLVTNVAQSSSHCTFNVHGMPLNRFHDVSSITAAGSTATFELGGQGGYLIWVTRNEFALASGYATLDCSAPVVAQVVYASTGGLGVVTGMDTVFSSQAGTVFQFPIFTQEATLGFAIANDTNTEASCRIILETGQRVNLGEATLPVPSKSNIATMLNEVIPIPAGSSGGAATVSCDQQVSVVGLQPAGAVFTTLPPAILSTTTPTPSRSGESVEFEFAFDLEFGHVHPRGITFANGRLYVANYDLLNEVGFVENKVYAYDVSGQRAPTYDFDGILEGDPGGITFANSLGRFYLLDSLRVRDGRARAYDASGQRVPAYDFGLRRPHDAQLWTGITFADSVGRFYLTYQERITTYLRPGAETIRAHHATGIPQQAFDIELQNPNNSIAGITFATGRLYVVDGGAKVYAYELSGQRAPAYDIDLGGLGPLAPAPTGITFGNGRFYVVDASNYKVYVFRSSR